MEFFTKLFSGEGFVPRAHCGDWSNPHIALHNIGDALTLFSYLAIPMAIVYYVRIRPTKYLYLFWMFATFILCCGITHLVEIVVFYWPIYRFAGIMKLCTGLVSFATAVAAWRLAPLLASMKTQEELENIVNERTEELRTAKEQLLAEAANKDHFLAMLSHELRNPMAPIANAVHICRVAQKGSQPYSTAFDMLDRQFTCLVKLVDDLLDLSRINQNKIKMKLDLVDLTLVIKQAVEVAQHLIDTLNHNLVVKIPSYPIFLYGDKMRLAQVVSNLLNNAAKYTNPGGEIRLTVVEETEKVHIIVRDNGRGIPEKLQGQVFDLFVQADESLERTGGGLGIGLTLAKKIIELHQGTISLKSEVGKGTEFDITLPSAESFDEGDDTTEVDQPILAKKILVADDNRDAADSLVNILKEWGYDARATYSGVDTIAISQDYLPDAILLDLGMPDCSGFDVARTLRNSEDTKNIQIIALTGRGLPTDEERSSEEGIKLHLIKPVKPEELRKIFDFPP